MDDRPCRSRRSRRRPTMAVAGPSRAVRRCAVTAALLSLSIGSLPLAVAQGPSPCPDGPPPGGCQNGLFSPSRCLCDCVPPFCRDGSGACSASAAGRCPTTASASPWEDCVPGLDCPWWDDPRRAGSCATGGVVPPGVREVSATRAECCARHHPGSGACEFDGRTAPAQMRASALISRDRHLEIETTSGYDVIPIRFAVMGLPAEVDEGALREEMRRVLRRVLSDAAKVQRDLRITGIEESPASNAGGPNGRGDEREAHFDVTILRVPGEDFGPVFVAWLKETYGDVVEYLEHYETMRYFGYGKDFYWCVDGGGGQQTSPLCSYEEEVVQVDFRLARLPKDFDADELAHQMKSVYRELLGGIERLDILSIETEVVNVTSAEGVDVFFDIHILQKYGEPEFAPAAREELKSPSSKEQVFDAIRSYADAQSLDLDWHVDSEGAFSARTAPAPGEDPSPSSAPSPPLAFPIWAIATIVALGILFCCCCFCGILWRIKGRDKIKNERNMVNYLQTGSAYPESKSRRYPQNKQQLELSYPSLQGPPPRHHKHRRSDRHGGLRHESHKHKSHKHKSHKHKKAHTHKSHRHERGRETAMDGHRRRIKTYRKEMSDSDARLSSSRARPPRKDTEYELKNAKSFVFPGVNGGAPPLEEMDEEMGRGGRRQGKSRQRRSRQGRSRPESSRPRKSSEDQGKDSRSHRVPRMDTEYQLEHMPTFVFGDDDGGGGDGDCPPPHLDLAEEDGYDDWDRDRDGNGNGGGDGDGDEYRDDGGEAHRPDPDGVRSSKVKIRGAWTVDGSVEADPPRKFVVHEVDSP